MDANRLRTGELVAAVSGVALLIIMFLPWFGFSVGGGEALEDITGVSVNVPEVSANFNAWESFDFIDLVLFVTAVVAIALGVATAMSQTVNLPVATSALTAGLGILATVLIIYRVLDTPGDADRKYGLFLGLIAAIGIAAGGWMSMQEEGTSFGGQADRLGDRLGGDDEPPAPPPPPPPPSSGAPPPSGP